MEKIKKNVLVLGANGFMGKHICLHLCRSGHNVFKHDLESSKEELKDYISKMRYNISYELDIPYDAVSIKAGTNEGFGDVGQNKAVEASCTILLKRV